MMTHRLVLPLVAVLLVGCSPSSPTQTESPTATATYSCVDPVTSSAAPCSKESYDANAEYLALVKEAQAVYERQVAEERRIILAGGLPDKNSTPEIDATMTDPAKTDYVALMNYQFREGIVAQKLVLIAKSRAAKAEIAGSAVTLETCNDKRGSVFVNRDGSDRGESWVVVTRYGFIEADGALKIAYAQADETTTCPF